MRGQYLCIMGGGKSFSDGGNLVLELLCDTYLQKVIEMFPEKEKRKLRVSSLQLSVQDHRLRDFCGLLFVQCAKQLQEMTTQGLLHTNSSLFWGIQQTQSSLMPFVTIIFSCHSSESPRCRLLSSHDFKTTFCLSLSDFSLWISLHIREWLITKFL